MRRRATPGTGGMLMRAHHRRVGSHRRVAKFADPPSGPNRAPGDPDQPITLYMRLVYATSMGEGGDIVRARELAAELVEDGKRILGPDHLTTLLARASFAYFTGQAG